MKHFKVKLIWFYFRIKSLIRRHFGHNNYQEIYVKFKEQPSLGFGKHEYKLQIEYNTFYALQAKV
jgi:hypothetical protein